MPGFNNRFNTANTGPNELGEGLGLFIKKTGKAIRNILAAGGQYTAAGFSKFLEKYGNQDPSVIANRQSLVQHHLNQGKQRIKKAGTGAVDAGKGARKAAKGAGKTVVQVGSHVIDGLKK